jgi:membrane fusion protein (multidrug efflux system)
MRTPQWILLPVAAAFMLAACGQGGQAGPAGKPPAPPAEVGVVSVTKGSTLLTQDLPGRVQAIRSAQIRARVEGVLEKRLFAEGSDVKAGAPLFHIDARTYKAAAESARADLALAKLNVDRYKPLLEQKAVSQQEFDVLLARFKQAEAALAKAELDLENASVPAPISGRIGRALVTEGALVGKGEATPLATIEQLDMVQVVFTQNGSDLFRLRQALKRGKLRQADQAQVELVLEDGSVFPRRGKVDFTDLAADPDTGAISLRAEFPNPGRELLPGTFVRIRFPQARFEDGVRLPQRAVLSGPQGQLVLTVGADGKVVPRPVKTGTMVGDDWLITDGLEGGEQVVVDGVMKARPGAEVKAVPVVPAKSAEGK